MLGSTASTVIAVVPPGSPASVDEPLREQIVWRKLVWAADDRGRPWEAASRQFITVTAVVRLLPDEERSWVRASCARQLQQLELWSAPATGHGHDQRAHDVADLRDRLRRECREAFVGEAWHASDEPEVPPIPTTVDALLQRIDFPDPARAEEIWNQVESQLERCYYAGVDVYRWLRVRRRQLMRTYDACRQALHRQAPPDRCADNAEQRPDTSEHELLAH